MWYNDDNKNFYITDGLSQATAVECKGICRPSGRFSFMDVKLEWLFFVCKIRYKFVNLIFI